MPFVTAPSTASPEDVSVADLRPDVPAVITAQLDGINTDLAEPHPLGAAPLAPERIDRRIATRLDHACHVRRKQSNAVAGCRRVRYEAALRKVQTDVLSRTRSTRAQE